MCIFFKIDGAFNVRSSYEDGEEEKTGRGRPARWRRERPMDKKDEIVRYQRQEVNMERAITPTLSDMDRHVRPVHLGEWEKAMYPCEKTQEGIARQWIPDAAFYGWIRTCLPNVCKVNHNENLIFIAITALHSRHPEGCSMIV